MDGPQTAVNKDINKPTLVLSKLPQTAKPYKSSRASGRYCCKCTGTALPSRIASGNVPFADALSSLPDSQYCTTKREMTRSTIVQDGAWVPAPAVVNSVESAGGMQQQQQQQQRPLAVSSR